MSTLTRLLFVALLALSAAASADTATVSVMVRVIPDNSLMADDSSTWITADDNATMMTGQ